MFKSNRQRKAVMARISSSMIKDERQAIIQYRILAKKEKNHDIRARLLNISRNEASHLKFWKRYKKIYKV